MGTAVTGCLGRKLGYGGIYVNMLSFIFMRNNLAMKVAKMRSVI